MYKSHSVLATGKWAKIAVTTAGVYKMDGAFLAALGFGSSLPSSAIRVYGNGGGMLPEANSGSRPDDLQEVAIEVVDGGDGVLNTSDYVLFFAQGPHHWQADSLNSRFTHQKNIYSDQSFYFITISGTGKRIEAPAQSAVPSVTVTTFDERYVHELDSVNFLSSGKEWFGEEFANTPGRVLNRTFSIPFVDVLTSQPVTLVSSAAARSVGTPSRFDVRLNNTLAHQLAIPAIAGNVYDLFAQQAEQESTQPANQSSLAVTFSYQPGSYNAQGWLNWFRVFCRRPLWLPNGGQLLFRDWASVGNTAAAYVVSNASSGTRVWEVTNPLAPVKMNGTLQGSQYTFSNGAQSLREYITFSASFNTPQVIGMVANQDLHHTTETDYFIITHPQFTAAAQRLAQFHQQRSGLRTLVVTTEQIFNEFSGGTPDPAALRDFVKMYYDRYRSTWEQKGKYLLLFGKASFDYKNRIKNNTAFVPAFESASSLDPLSTYTSDDFFGFLDDSETMHSAMINNQLDIGIGRVPAKTEAEAKAFVDKVEAYHAAAAQGPWRNNLDFIADDEDNNLHVQDMEVITATAATAAPVFNQHKIYLDAYRQEGGSAGGRYPQANEVMNNHIYNGTLIWNYTGHGGPQRLAEEVVIDQQIVNSWNNPNRLPLVITATCDFAPFDNPTTYSLGEDLLVRPKTGAIALMTTTRIVFAFSNRILNNNYLQTALQKDSSGHYKTLGEALRTAKNYTYQTSGDITNNRKFALLGDPAMTLAFPALQVKATAINGQDVTSRIDTLSATERITLEGEVTDNRGQLQDDFNGTVYLSLLDKPQSQTTLANDAGSAPYTFQVQNALLFKGKATVSGGRFSVQFKMPKDINYRYDRGKISLYAQDGKTDGNGYSSNIIIGGISTAPITDADGPEIKAYLNDERFVNGSITNPHPVLIVKLVDSSGINIGSNSIDHDIVATLDGDNNTYYVLNNFYETELDNYQKGTVRFQLPGLKPGPHSLKIKAWDVLNNSAEQVLDFTVTSTEELQIAHVLNYPNPFTTRTAFWFEHNQPLTDLAVKVEIYTVSGKLVKTLKQTINTSGNRSNETEWDGRDEFGNKLARGVYIYHLQVAAQGKKSSRWERLVLLN